MNWRLSALDRLTLVSNSDAHSAAKLGREANILDTELSYPAITEAIRTRKGFSGTIEFFPEEGKYHYDGHRDCGVSLSPKETLRFGCLCPVCGTNLNEAACSCQKDGRGEFGAFSALKDLLKK
mgnify:CR=1 FL=1